LDIFTDPGQLGGGSGQVDAAAGTVARIRSVTGDLVRQQNKAANRERAKASVNGYAGGNCHSGQEDLSIRVADDVMTHLLRRGNDV
jgi:hypothetical protein